MDTTTQVVTGMTEAQVTELTSSLTSFAGTLLDYFIDLLPAIAICAAIGFVIAIVRKKVRA